jgi:two-component system response regulator PilR (NtrC family)
MGSELQPLLSAPLRDAEPDTVQSEIARPLRVLVVDDELLIRWSIGTTLVTLGHRVFEAVDAASTRHLLEHLDRPVDVVLLDYRLPDSDDLVLLEDIRRITPRSAVVMMTAFGAPDIAPAAKALGVHAVIEKPFDVRTLESELLRACASRTT